MARKRKEVEVLEFKGLTRDDFVYGINFTGSPDINFGKRGFNVIVPEDMVDGLLDEGWNVKPYEDRDTGMLQHFLPVEVRFDKYPPIICIIGSKTNVLTELDEVSCGKVDSIIRNKLVGMDVTIAPSVRWEDEAWKIKAYLDEAIVTFRETDTGIRISRLRSTDQPVDDGDDVPF